MGEAKRRKYSEQNLSEYERMMIQIERELTDKGLLIEAGWIGLRKVWLKEHAPGDIVNYSRMAFMAGAAHMYHSMMGIMEDGDEPTAKDLERMKKIHNELTRFNEEMKAMIREGGNA